MLNYRVVIEVCLDKNMTELCTYNIKKLYVNDIEFREGDKVQIEIGNGVKINCTITQILSYRLRFCIDFHGYCMESKMGINYENIVSITKLNLGV